jgi:hypothetical protein
MCLLPNDKFIQNINIPSCKNCIHFKSSFYNNDFSSSLNKCGKFGEKNIITDEIKYFYADSCRIDENKCGENGFYFEEDKNINRKILLHKIITNTPYGIPLIILISNLIIGLK